MYKKITNLFKLLIIAFIMWILFMGILFMNLEKEHDTLVTRYKALQSIVLKQGQTIEKLKKETATPKIFNSRSEIVRSIIRGDVTAYCSESCNKTPRHPLYGITKSGVKAKENHTIAMSEEYPFGTKVFIPYFNKTFVVEDRGSSITDNRIDIYMSSKEKCLEFGKKYLDIYILK